MTDRWNPERFNWRSVLTAPTFDPSRVLIAVVAFAAGAAVGGSAIAALALMVLALGVVGEYLIIVGRASLRERARLAAWKDSR